MDSAIAQAIRAEIPPVAIVFSDTKPEGAMQFTEGRWGCVMWLLANAAKGRRAVADSRTFGCIGGGVGLGFGNQYLNWPGGIECFYSFLTTGDERTRDAIDTDPAKAVPMSRSSAEHILHGEGYLKTPELAARYVAALPMTEVPARYVVLEPLADVGAEEHPEVVIFLVDPDRLAALTVLANYDREDNEGVIMPFAAGCQSIGILPYREGHSQHPRAVVGLVDISARAYIAPQVGGGLMSFAIPFAMFERMEANVAGSFLERSTWKKLIGD